MLVTVLLIAKRAIRQKYDAKDILMITKELIVANKLGLHARAAAKLVALASNFASEISIQKGERKVNGKSIMGVMMLAASKNTIVNINIEGEDEQQAMTEIEKLFTNLFDEEE